MDGLMMKPNCTKMNHGGINHMITKLSIENMLYIAPNYDLATCQIEKVMTTIRDAIFCYLRDPIGFKAHDRRISSESWSESFCGFSNYRSNIDDVERQMGKKYKRFALIRNPFERFLSGYVDKCLKKILRYFIFPKCCFCDAAEEFISYCDETGHFKKPNI
ncbi:hypothetical protein NECAME_01829 [Necator americanus]|uniref:Carbohydrate sulfotransferase n=1 Tax=Necator americanus TaxID=51031 RepID=W2TLP7_NECAM|nr:hypothetical protein NECAME_01829 [Necator americanus]ETN83030.1 hypothetical protein NECAME_01829 [Necator americanus]